MKNIFKEYKKLKAEKLQLKFEIERLHKENNEDNLRMREYYEKTYEKRLEFEKFRYKTIMKRKKEVIQICKNLENKLNVNITSLIDLDITTDINAYIMLLNYLKEN